MNDECGNWKLEIGHWKMVVEGEQSGVISGLENTLLAYKHIIE